MRINIILIILLLNGCAMSDPDVWPGDFIPRDELPDLIGKNEQTVIQVLGIPNYVFQSNETISYMYQMLEDDFLLNICGPYYVNSCFEKATEASCVLLKFDKDGKLKKYQTKNIGMLPRLGEFAHCRELFNINAGKVIDGCIYVRIGGDINIDDQYKIYERSPSDPSSLQSLCDAADLGHPRAQLEVGARYALGIYGVQVDHIRAYVWYSLANRGCYDDVRYELLKQGMATQQIAEAELMLADWEPGQCEKALIRRQIND